MKLIAFSIALVVLLSALAACSSPTPVPTTEHDVLMALYESTNGDDWSDNSGWGTKRDICKWHGLTCNDERSVKQLELSQNNLTGSIPPELGNRHQ
jgi:hypothetical protein